MERHGRSLHPHVGMSAPDGEMNTLDRSLMLDGVKMKWRSDAFCGLRVSGEEEVEYSST